jgi:hypothetical protein
MKRGLRSWFTSGTTLAFLMMTGAGSAAEAKTDAKKTRLPAAVVKAIDDNKPGAEIAKVDIEHEEGVTFYDMEFKGNHGEMDVLEDGTVLDVATIIELKDLPEPVAAVIRKASAGTTIKQLSKSEVRAKIEKAGGKGKVARLATPEYVYEAELAKGGEIEVAGDGKIIKGPKSMEKGSTAEK